jgi:mRNA-degrading endonuclease RelE of RelBE toxin-antitoxin system
MVIVESPVFTRQVQELLPDDQYRGLQWRLAMHPDAGALVQGTGGLRKVRWNSGQRGKRGGVRVIYYHAAATDQLRMLLIYRKGLKDDLTAIEKRVLRELNRGW